MADREITPHDQNPGDGIRPSPSSPRGGCGPADNDGYDDCVMALAIACICASTEGPVISYEGPADRQRDASPIAPSWEEWVETPA